jgi:hypothetical protein
MLGEDIILFADRCSIAMDGAAAASRVSGGGSSSALSGEVAATAVQHLRPVDGGSSNVSSGGVSNRGAAW